MTETKKLLRTMTDAQLLARQESARKFRLDSLMRRNQADANKMMTLICRIDEVLAERFS